MTDQIPDPTSDPTSDPVASAYGARADEYVDAVGRISHAEEADLRLVGTWAHRMDGPLVDVGCGPGQWTHWLHSRGVGVEGVDPVPEFIDLARQTYPEVPYRLGQARDLGVAPGSLGGILAWYSLIHLPPAGIDAALAEFARCLRTGGGLLLGFFTAGTRTVFDHAVAPAYYWPVPALVSLVEDAGFTVTHAAERPGRPGRAHGEITAVKAGPTSSTSP